MIDFTQYEHLIEEAKRPLTRPERERVELLLSLERERPKLSPRRWLAETLVRIGASLDPEAPESVAVRVRA